MGEVVISHLIAVFIGAAFVGVPVGICAMALLTAGREREDRMKPPIRVNVWTQLDSTEPEGIDWSRIGV